MNTDTVLTYEFYELIENFINLYLEKSKNCKNIFGKLDLEKIKIIMHNKILVGTIEFENIIEYNEIGKYLNINLVGIGDMHFFIKNNMAFCNWGLNYYPFDYNICEYILLESYKNFKNNNFTLWNMKKEWSELNEGRNNAIDNERNRKEIKIINSEIFDKVYYEIPEFNQLYHIIREKIKNITKDSEVKTIDSIKIKDEIYKIKIIIFRNNTEYGIKLLDNNSSNPIVSYSKEIDDKHNMNLNKRMTIKESIDLLIKISNTEFENI